MKKLLFLSISLLILNTHADIKITNKTNSSKIYAVVNGKNNVYSSCAITINKDMTETLPKTTITNKTCPYTKIDIEYDAQDSSKKITIPVQDGTTYLVTESNGKISASPSNNERT